jgi:hypothetical protein
MIAWLDATYEKVRAAEDALIVDTVAAWIAGVDVSRRECVSVANPGELLVSRRAGLDNKILEDIRAELTDSEFTISSETTGVVPGLILIRDVAVAQYLRANPHMMPPQYRFYDRGTHAEHSAAVSRVAAMMCDNAVVAAIGLVMQAAIDPALESIRETILAGTATMDESRRNLARGFDHAFADPCTPSPLRRSVAARFAPLPGDDHDDTV